MLHLSPERLAALADSEPTALEADHLAVCATCARERAANRSLLVMARAEREQLGMPLTRWDSLAPELHREGLVAAGALMSDAPAARALQPPGARPGGTRRLAGWLQAAAVVLLIAGGAVAGRVSAGASPLPFGTTAEDPGGRARHGGPAITVAPVMPAAREGVEVLIPEFRSVDEALAALTRFEVAYQETAAFLAEHDSTTRLDDPRGYRTRLAALDRAGSAMREALREAPYDPVINGYYLTTLGQRRATLRQLNTALPEDRRIWSF